MPDSPIHEPSSTSAPETGLNLEAGCLEKSAGQPSAASLSPTADRNVPAASGKVTRRERRSAEIVAAARDMLETQGLEGLSVAVIAQSIGVSEATVFSYFGTRRELMAAVIADWMEPVLDRLERDIPSIAGARNQLLFFTMRHLQELALSPGMHRLIYRELHWDNYYGSALHRLNQRYTSIATRVFEDGVASGEFGPHFDIGIERDMLFGAFHHIGWRTLMNGRPLDIPLAANALVNQLCTGLCAQDKRAATDNPALDTVLTRLEAIAERLDPANR